MWFTELKVKPSNVGFDALSESARHDESPSTWESKRKLMRAPLQAYWPPLTLFAADFMVLLSGMYFSVGWLMAIMTVACIIMLFDVQARMKDFQYALMHIAAGRRPDRIANILRASWCCRIACIAAADASGVKPGKKVREFYLDAGYRWYHVFPDGTFTLETPFRYLQFWKVTLFGYAQARGRPVVRMGTESASTYLSQGYDRFRKAA
jgi:hypothetical protein